MIAEASKAIGPRFNRPATDTASGARLGWHRRTSRVCDGATKLDAPRPYYWAIMWHTVAAALASTSLAPFAAWCFYRPYFQLAPRRAAYDPPSVPSSGLLRLPFHTRRR